MTNNFLEKLQTGDLVLVNGHSTNFFYKLFDNLIKYGTHSNYTHVGFIVRDPNFIDNPLKGIYIWESSWEGTPDPQDGKVKLGVQLTLLQDFVKNNKGNKILFRKLECSENTFTTEKLKNIHTVVYNKPYDIVPKDWIEALLRKDDNPQKTNRFWCSALVGYIYTRCGLLKADTDWSILRPCDFSLDGQTVEILNGSLYNEEVLLDESNIGNIKLINL